MGKIHCVPAGTLHPHRPTEKMQQDQRLSGTKPLISSRGQHGIESLGYSRSYFNQAYQPPELRERHEGTARGVVRW